MSLEALRREFAAETWVYRVRKDYNGKYDPLKTESCTLEEARIKLGYYHEDADILVALSSNVIIATPWTIYHQNLDALREYVSFDPVTFCDTCGHAEVNHAVGVGCKGHCLCTKAFA